MLLKKWKDKLYRHLKKSLSALHDKPLAPPTDEEKKMVEELKTTFHELRILETKNSPASEKEWFNHINSLRELVLNDNPREFLRWHVISSTMFVKHANYITPELNYLKSRHNWKDFWSKIIKESPIGHPTPYWRYPRSSGNLIHHAYHLAKFEEKTATRTNTMDYIFEFGGGYGSMCRLLYNSGFKGKYVIFDFPPFSALQRFFLKSNSITVHSVDSFKAAKNGAVCISAPELLKETILNDFNVNNSLFIATWSISEAPIGLRNLILPLASQFTWFLIGYQNQFKEINNADFFTNWKTNQRDVEWYEWEINHLPTNKYLIGKRNTNKHS